MKTVLYPAIALMNRLSFGMKFSLISVLFFVPMIVTNSYLVRDSYRQYVATQAALDSLDLLGETLVLRRTLENFADLVEIHSVIGQSGAAGDLEARLLKLQASLAEDLQDDLETLLQRPVRLANDADCLAWSEATDGAGAGAASVFAVILGTGVGGGLVIHGRLLGGPNAIAGEWGHNPLPWRRGEDGPVQRCYCGQDDCIETFLSGPGWAARSGLGLDAPALISAAKANDGAAQRALATYCDQLARGLASVINLLDPQVIVLGGGLSNIAELYTRVPPLLPRYVFSDRVNTRLLPAQHGDSSGVRGAAWLWNE